jgi:hypothetical protein
MAEELAQIQEELLPQCTVRIFVGEQPRGTGFYAAPGLIVTCEHVIRSSAEVSLRGGGSTISALDAADARYEADSVKTSDRHDLAVIRLRTAHDHPCVLLDADLRPNDEMHTVGYPTDKNYGLVPTTLIAEGQIQGPSPWHKLKGGQVRHGMSGSPVLNNRTGSVCSVLKRTRGDRADLGGYAVPVTLLQELEPQLLQENERYHTRFAQWTDRLPADVRRLREATQKARGAEDPAEMQFILDVGLGADGWSVSAVAGGCEVGPVPVDLNNVRVEVARLFRDWACRGRIRLVGGEVALLGGILYRAVFPGEIGARFAEARETAQRVAVVLRFDKEIPDDLKQLPWEHLFVPAEGGGSGVALAREPGLTFYRALRNDASHGRTDRQTLSMLVIAVKPRVDSQPDRKETAAAVDSICSALKALESTSGLSIDILEPADIETLGDQVAGYDVVHYVGFGGFNNGLDELAFAADQLADGFEFVQLEAFREAVLRGSPDLVVLQSCEAAFVSVPADFAVVAPALLDRVPALIGCQYPMTTDAASRFNKELYQQLVRGTPVDVAVQQARGKLAQHGRLSVSPALFLRGPGTLRLTAQRYDVAAQRTQQAFATA